MFNVTWTDGRIAQIDGTSVVRIRRAVIGEGGATRIDLSGGRYQLVAESPESVAKMAAAELKSLTSVRDTDKGRVWFNAKGVIGPVYVNPYERKDTAIQSALLIFAPRREYTADTASEVAKSILDAGGSPQPLPKFVVMAITVWV